MLIRDADHAKQLGLSGIESGALVVGDRMSGNLHHSGKPCRQAGNIDDVIIEIEGKKITEDDSLREVIHSHVPGDTVKLKIWRKGKTSEKSVKLEEFNTPEK